VARVLWGGLPVACSERQIAPGFAIPSNGAARLTPSPIRLPSLSSTTSPMWMQIRKDDLSVLGDSGVALDYRVLRFDRTPHGVDCAAELDDASVAGALDDAAIMHRNRGVNEIAAQRPQSRQNAIFIRAGERLYPTTSEHRMAASLRVSPIAKSPCRQAQPGNPIRIAYL
jgi:hypothetical protein